MGTGGDPEWDDDHWSDLHVRSEQCTTALAAPVRLDLAMVAEPLHRDDEPAYPDSRQVKFDAELRRRIAHKEGGPEGYRDVMIQWAQSNLPDVPPADAMSLWDARSKSEFPRKGRHKKQKSG